MFDVFYSSFSSFRIKDQQQSIEGGTAALMGILTGCDMFKSIGYKLFMKFNKKLTVDLLQYTINVLSNICVVFISGKFPLS